MLTEQEQQQIRHAVAASETVRAALPEALRIVQRRQGWVSDAQLDALAAFLAVTPEALEEVATFYTMIHRRPVGRHVILLCTSVSCWIMGVNPLYAHLQGRLGITYGDTTADGRFTLLPAVCLGACDRAPAMMVDDDLHGELTPERLEAILARYV